MVVAGGRCCFPFAVRLRVRQLEETVDRSEQSPFFFSFFFFLINFYFFLKKFNFVFLLDRGLKIWFMDACVRVH
jgi:hypothetical protein